MTWAKWVLCVTISLFGAVARSKAKRASQSKKKSARQPAARTSATRRTARSTARSTARRSARSTARRSARAVTRRPATAARVRPAAVIAPLPSSPPNVPAPVVQPSPPMGRARLISPENEKLVDSVHPTFRWLSIGGATRYQVVWGEDPTLSVPHTLQSIATEATVPLESPLQPGKTYYWRVRGGNASGWSPWSETYSFRVLEELP